MIIGIDASRALKARTGTEVHNAEIIKHMVAIDHDDTFRLYSNKPPHGDMDHLARNVEWRVMPFARGWTLFRLSLEMIGRQPDVLFIPAHILPLIPPRKSVVMIHDLGFDHFPELYKWTDKLYHRFAVRYAKWFADIILTPSEYTRQDLHKKYRVSLDRIVTVHHGFDPQTFRPIKSSDKRPMDTPYFYFVGRLERKKNIIRMLEAFKRFKEQTGLPHHFVLAGRHAYGWEEIEAAWNAMGEYKSAVHFLGFVGQDKATNWLRHADALVFTTLFEGFGFPVLEAYASGVPAIASNTTSLPEVAGDGAILVDPTSISQIADALATIATDKPKRQALIAAGNQQLKQFSWSKAAEQTLAVLKKVGCAR